MNLINPIENWSDVVLLESLLPEEMHMLFLCKYNLHLCCRQLYINKLIKTEGYNKKAFNLNWN